MTPKLFSELGLTPEVLKAVDKLGFEQASPIQAESIPLLLGGRDVVGQSQTGSGKTAAFAIPAIEKVDPSDRTVQALILCPTRELAVQVSEEIHKLALFKRGIHALPIYGGQSYDRQFLGLKQGVQIVIGTPGRVMDHMRRGTLRLDKVRMVVLDEADVMLDMGFREDIEFILQAVPVERQTVFFSATMPRPIQELIQKYSREPQNVRIEQKALTVPTVEQVYYEVDRRFKIELLTRLIDLHDYRLGIIFCNTKRMVDDLTDHLNAQGYSADRLHGDMSQAMRDRVMNKFRKSGLEFLIATDVAARGIDVDDVQVVFNYDLPYDPEDYVHRIGRTGRAGRSGRAISFVAGREMFQIYHIERYTRTRVARAKVPTLSEVEEARADAMLDRVRATLKKGEFKKQEHLVELLLEEGFTSTDIAAALLHQIQMGDVALGAHGGSARDRTENAEPVRAPRERAEERRFDRPERRRREFDRDDRSSLGRAPARPEPRPRRSLPEERPLRSSPPVEKSSRGADKAVPPVLHPSPEAPEIVLEKSEPGERPAPKTHPKTKEAVPPPRGPKASRRTPEDQIRLYINVGAEMGVEAGDVVGAIMGETGLPAKTVGRIDIRERHLFVDVDAVNANRIISKLNRTQIKGNKVKVKAA